MALRLAVFLISCLLVSVSANAGQVKTNMGLVLVAQADQRTEGSKQSTETKGAKKKKGTKSSGEATDEEPECD